MKTLYPAIITIACLAIIGTTIVLFETQPMKTKDDSVYEILKTKPADASVSRLVKPENICFDTDDKFLGQFPTVIDRIKMADDNAKSDMQNGIHYGNYYTGEGGLPLDKDTMISLIKKYNFNRTVSYSPLVYNSYKYKFQDFSCNFGYNNNFYHFNFKFSSLYKINGTWAFARVDISNETLAKPIQNEVPTYVVYAPYNNTFVFVNSLDSWITVKVQSNSSEIVQKIPSHDVQDIFFRYDWTRINDTLAHFEVDEHPKIAGNVIIKRPPICMSQETAKSLYSQRDFKIKFPSYVPDGFEPACYEENLDTFLVETFANKTGIAENRKPNGVYPYGINPFDHDKNGIIIIDAIKEYGQNMTDVIYQDYQMVKDQPTLEQPSFEIKKGTVISAYKLGFVSTVNLGMGDERYRLQAKLPIEELIKIVKSLS